LPADAIAGSKRSTAFRACGPINLNALQQALAESEVLFLDRATCGLARSRSGVRLRR
jgi:hypothetical protein